MKKKIAILSLCSLVLLSTGCGKVAKLKNGQEVVASVEGKKITAEDLYNELKKQGGTSVLINQVDAYIADKEIKTDDTVKEYAASQLEQIKAQYEQSGQDFAAILKNAGYESENDFKEVLMLDYKKEQVAKNFLKDELTEKEIQEYYDEEIFGAATVRHILITPDVSDDASDDDKKKAEEKAKKEAEDIIKELEKSDDVEKTFKELAKEKSDDTATASNGGLFSDFKKEEVVSDFWDASYKLKDGEFSKKPVKSDYGYHVILKISQKEKPSLKDSETEIKDTLVSNKLSNDTNLFDKTWDRIRKEKYKLKIEDSSLNKSYEDVISNIK